MVGISFALALVVWAASILWRRRANEADRAPPPIAHRSSWIAVHAIALLGSWPLLAAAPAFLHATSILPGDAPAFARVAATIAKEGMPHGWIDVYAGGFPGAMHYQPLAVAIIAAAIRAGAAPVVATNLVGIASLLALPQALIAALRWSGARPLAALAGALVLTLIAPERPLVGGWDAHVAQGIVAQVSTMPLLVLACGAATSTRTRWLLPILAWLCAAGHPQLVVTALGLGALGLVAADPRKHRDAAWSFVVVASSSAIALVALYAHGLASFRIPFGFPQLQGWRLIGFHPERFTEFIAEGALLDRDRLPITMAAWTVSLVALLACATSPRSTNRDAGAARFLIAIAVASVLLPFSGYFLMESALLAKLVRAITPTRVVVFCPIVCAASIAIAFDAGLAWLDRWPPRVRWSVAVIAIGAFTAIALPTSARRIATRKALDESRDCGRPEPAGFDVPTIASWLRPLRGGRLYIDPTSFNGTCPAMRGAHLASGAPLAEHTGGPGTQVGLNIAAVDSLDLRGDDGAARAEALGIRYVLHTASRAPGPASAWSAIARREDVVLSERIGGGDLWDVACLGETWSGDEASLRQALLDDFAARGPAIADPHRAVALVSGIGPRTITRAEVPCDVAGARIEPIAREPGAYEAFVEAPTGSLAVLRATAHPSWIVRVDGGAPLTLANGLTRIAPGYLAIPLTGGRHHIEAVVRIPRTYIAACFASAALAIAASIHLRKRHREPS